LLSLEESYAAYADNVLVLDQEGHPIYFGNPKAWPKLSLKLEELNQKDVPDSPSSSVPEANAKNGEDADEESNSQSETNTKRQTGDLTTWLYYGKAVGLTRMIILAMLVVVTVVGVNAPSLLLKWDTEKSPSVGSFVGLFTMVTIVAWLGQNAMVA
jgi:hypothetical protein